MSTGGPDWRAAIEPEFATGGTSDDAWEPTPDLTTVVSEAILRRVAEAAYRIGAKDMRHRAAKEVQRFANARMVRGEWDRLTANIHGLDPTQAEPDWIGMARAALRDGP